MLLPSCWGDVWHNPMTLDAMLKNFPSFQAITSSGTKKGDLFIADVNTQLKNKNVTTDIKVDTNSNVSLSSPVVLKFSCIQSLTLMICELKEAKGCIPVKPNSDS